MNGDGARILLVDDDVGHQELIARAFASSDFQAHLLTAATLREARAHLRQSFPDLLIVDLLLPDGRGTELLSTHGDRAAFPTVVMTSFGNEQAAVEILRSGALDYVVKSSAALADMPHIARRALRQWNNIVERERAERALRESEQWWNSVFERSRDAIFIADGDGRLVEANEAAARLTGYGTEDLKRMSIRDVRAPEDLDAFEALFQHIMAGEAITYEAKILRKDGTKFDTELSNRRITIGGATYVHTVARDISRRKRFEAIRRLSHRLLEVANRHTKHRPMLKALVAEIQGFTECDSVGIRVLDHEGRIPYEAYTGFPDEFYRMESPLSIRSDACMCASVIRGSTDPKRPNSTSSGSFFLNGTTRFLAGLSEKEKGETRNVCNQFGYESVALVPIRMMDRILGLIHVADHRENKVPLELVEALEAVAPQLGTAIQRASVEKALQESERKYRALVERSLQGILILRNFRILFANAAAAEITGLTVEEILSITPEQAQDLLYPEDRDAVFQRLTGRFAGKSVSPRHEYRLRRRDGREMWLDAFVSRIEYDGEPAVQVAFVDISDRKRAEAELARAKEAAEAANRAKSDFLANMSHEIRTPMTAILGFADLLMAPGLSPQDQQQYLQTVHRNGQTLLELIDDVLDLSKIEAGRIEAEPTECSIWDVVEDVVSSMRLRAEEKGLDLRAGYEFPLPGTIRTSPVRLRQILVNLVGNAVKFTEEGNVQITVRCRTSRDGPPRMEFAISDTGIGMAPEEVSRLFRPFTQADTSATRRFGGTGLGLTICRHLAEILGGDIHVETEPGLGSTFTLAIDPGPLDEKPMLSEKPPAESKPAVAGGARALSGRVLLAEDGRDVRQLLGVVLEDLGLEVDLAEDGQIALQKALASVTAGQPYDLILMDIQMPEIDGYAATRQLRRDGWMGPIVALTAHAMIGDREKCLGAGCDDYLVKPVDRAAMMAVLERYLEQTCLTTRRTADRPHRLAGSNGPLISRHANHPVLAGLLKEFVGELPARVSRIEEALQSGDLQRVAELTHQLKGAAGIYGFDPIAETAHQISKQIVQGDDPQQIQAVVAELALWCRQAAAGEVRRVSGHQQP
ncbi:MAG: PAS domain S-box protein [Pirellulales bacterium]|nr:PAS domain S-box protein [Pirellulales bacterium]